MEESIAGGMFGGLSIAGRHEVRADREYVVAFAPWHGFQTINGRAFVGNTPVFEARVGEDVQWNVMAMGDEFHTFHVHGHRWLTDRGTPQDTRGLGPAESFRVRSRENAPGTWLYHCHVETHMAQGMIGLYRCGRDAPPRTPGSVALLLAAPAGARAETTTISMPGKFFDPPRATMVAGDTVLFRNSDLVTHDVVISPFGSGPIARFTSWSQQIDQPGGYPFLCTLHAFMRGNLDVVAATLAAAPDGALAGEPLTLSGRTKAGTAHIDVEQSLSGAAWSAVGAGAAPAPDGMFATTVQAVEGASYRAATPAGPSPPSRPGSRRAWTSTSTSNARAGTRSCTSTRRRR